MNSETAERIKQLLKRREDAKHVVVGEVIAGRIKVWQRAPQGSMDGSNLYLVEHLKGKKAGTANIWRACDIRRLKRGLQPKVNKCEIWWRHSFTAAEVEICRKYMEEDLAWARERLKELKGQQVSTVPAASREA